MSDQNSQPSEWLKFLREEVRFEYNLTAHRVAWFLTSQTFLISAFVLGYFNKEALVARDIFGHVIPFIGIISSILLRISIFVSHQRIWIHSSKPPFNFSNHYDVLGSGLRGWAMFYARFVPWMFLNVWITILVSVGFQQSIPPIYLFVILSIVFFLVDIYLAEREVNPKKLQNNQVLIIKISSTSYIYMFYTSSTMVVFVMFLIAKMRCSQFFR